MNRQFPTWFMIGCVNVLIVSLLTVTLVPAQAKVSVVTEQKKEQFLLQLTNVLIPKCIEGMKPFFPKEWVSSRNQAVTNASTRYKNSASSQSLQKVLSSESCRTVIAQLNALKISKNATVASNKQLYAEVLTISVSYVASVVVLWVIGACAINEACQSFVTNQIIGTLRLGKATLGQVGAQVKERLQRYNESDGKILPSYNEYSRISSSESDRTSSCNQVDVQSLRQLKDKVTELQNDLQSRQRTNHKQMLQNGNNLGHRINEAFKNIITRHHQKYAPGESLQSAIARWTQSPKNGSFTPKETKQMAEKFRTFVNDKSSVYHNTIREMTPSTSGGNTIFSLAIYFFDVSVELLGYFTGLEIIGDELARLKKGVDSIYSDVIAGNCTTNTVQKIEQYKNQYKHLLDLNRLNRFALERLKAFFQKVISPFR